MSTTDILIGKLVPKENLTGKLISTPDQPLRGLLTQATFIGGGIYTGEYVADPRKVAQEFETHGKLMMENFVVNPIYRLDVDNPSGGVTVTLGFE